MCSRLYSRTYFSLFSSIVLTYLNFGNLSVVSDPINGLVLSDDDASVSLWADWAYQWYVSSCVRHVREGAGFLWLRGEFGVCLCRLCCAVNFSVPVAQWVEHSGTESACVVLNKPSVQS